MTVSDKAGKELSKLTYTYDLAGNKLTSVAEVDGKTEQTTFSYDDNNRLTKLENKDGATTYTYDQNGNRISSKKNDEKLDYIYDTENRLLAVKDKEGKYTYQLFKREEKKKSPYTAPAGEEHSLFWYGFSQNVLQALSSLPQTVGTIWHEIFDDVSIAYHKKVAKDRANEEGLVVNPPSIGELPGEGEVTYASQVKDVLIPYTTREDSFNYYEERNYVNDINREYTEVLQTYDRELKGRETYTYGHGRASYLNHETGDHYNYLTNQSGSVTGLTKEGEAVASTSYNLYGSTKQSTDEIRNPFAYNGEARDITGLDYLRARYYDSQAGTFLTEDSYQGQVTNPLSQNRYAYAHNNPVNYTDPSGHFRQAKRFKPARSRASQRMNLNLGTALGKAIAQIGNTVVSAAQSIMSHTVQEIQYTTQYMSALIHAPAEYRPVITNLWQQARAMRQSVYDWGTSLTREAQNITRNWTPALEATMRHVCDPKTTKARDKGGSPKPISFGGGGVASWDGTSGPSSRYQSNASVPAKSKKSTKKRENSPNYSVRLGGAASWDGISSTSNQPQTSSKKGHAFDTSRLKNISSGNIFALSGIAGLLVGLLGGPVAGFAVYGAVSSGLTSYSNDDKPFDVAVNTAGGALQGYFVGKYVEGVYIAVSGAVAGSGVTLNQSKQADKPYGPQPASGPLEPLKPYGPQPATGNLEPLKPLPNLENMTRVGRWMSPEEYAKMLETGKVQMSPNGNRAYVANPADINGHL
ncbi:RHS repeat-associated core domain-containing protein [Streptococcus acidominimus]|nr:RHS repeat-associated core domain-containing protein [Streptococcus acidominimus]